MQPILLLFAFMALLFTLPAHAADPCPQLRTHLSSTDVATRIAAIACQENHAWFRTFIDADGRVGGQAVYEAENDALADGAQAWRKVADYWNGAGLGSDCGRTGGAACRSFVVDTPWSAAFVSWVLRQARVPGFAVSSRHVDYVRAASRTATGPYQLVAPKDATPAPGDLLCYVRGQSRAVGYHGLLGVLAGSDGGLPMHCDIVVATEAGIAWLVGGNVQQTVALRMLRLDAQGRLSDLPMRNAADATCSPDAPAQCNLNRQDWAALLKFTANVPPSLLAARP